MNHCKGSIKCSIVYLLVIALFVTSMALSPQTASAAAKKRVTSVTLVKPAISTLTLKKGQSYSLKVSVLPKNASNKKVSYKSKKSSIVSVSSKGKLKARKVGTTTITITAKDSSKKKATLKVRVVKSLTKVSKVSLNYKNLVLYAAGGKQKDTLKATFNPKKATVKKVVFTSSDSSVASVNASGVVTARKAGKASITAYAADGWGAKAVCKVEVKSKPDSSAPAKTTIVLPTPSAPVNSLEPTGTPKPTRTPMPTAEAKSGEELPTTDFTLVKSASAPTIFLDSSAKDYKGLKLVAESFQKDIKTVSNTTPTLIDLPDGSVPTESEIIVVGSLGNNSLIDKWVAEKKIYVGDIKPYWETFSIIAVENPEPGISKALVIVGSDKRGAIYGMYHISEMIGVSPWYYWGDVDIKVQRELSFTKEEINYTSKEPSVKYRGIFLNDEAPSLSSWVDKNFATSGKQYNEKFYKNVYELILRLKGNYLWPAMWNSRFGTDGVNTSGANAELADAYGIVMGTSHHEPMMRADKEWNDESNKYGNGQWNYYTNKTGLNNFWNAGAARSGKYENVITLGIRGQNDSSMLPAGSTVQENVDLLKDCISNQKAILNKNNLEKAPKVLTLYKEVEEYWYGENGVKGLKDWDELDDVTIMLAEDNFGNLRTLPTSGSSNRQAGWGMYYHFDYHGAPTSYEWVHTLQMQKTWEQMTMAYDYGVDQVWIVNVGDLKPMEMPISYFLDMAYDFDTWGSSDTDSADKYTEQWVKQQFGNNTDEQGLKDIAYMMKEYTKLNGSRKPEIVAANTYSVTNYNEAMRMLDRIKALITLADSYKNSLPQKAQASYYQFVYYPAVASANVHRMQIYAGLMNLYANQGRSIANLYADLVKDSIAYDKELQSTYNINMPGLANKYKWDGMMSSVHVGYTSWDSNGAAYPVYDYIEVPEEEMLIVGLQESSKVYGSGSTSSLEFTNLNKESYYVDIANGGGTAFNYTASADKDWIKLTKATGTVLMQETIGVSIDYSKVSSSATGTVTITGADETVTIPVSVKVESTSGLAANTFVEAHDYISIEAAHYADAKAGESGAQWKEIKNYGKTLSSLKVWPTTSSFTDVTKAPYVEYKVKVNSSTDYVLQTYVAPSNNVDWDKVTMKYGVSIDGGIIQQKDTMNGAKVSDIRNPNGSIDGTKFVAGNYNSGPWSANVRDNIRLSTTEHSLTAGVHTVRIYAVDPALVLQKLVLYPKNKALPSSYFGPEESYYEGKTVTQAKLTADYQENQIYVASCSMPATQDGNYKVIVPKDGEYKVGVEADCANATIDVLWNSTKIGSITADGNGVYSATSKINFKKEKGTLSFAVSAGTATIKNVKVVYVPKVIIGDPIYIRASSEDGTSYATNVYDKSRKTLWTAAKNDANPYLEFDFVNTANIDRIAMTEGNQNVTKYEIRVYNGSTWETVYKGGEISNGASIFLQGKKEIKGQKMRIVFTEFTDAPSIKEVDVTPYINWARADGNVTLSGQKLSKDEVSVPNTIIDGDRITKALEDSWGSTTTTTPHVITMEFGQERLIDTLNVISLQDAEYNAAGTGVNPDTSMKTSRAQKEYIVYYHDGSNWKKIGTTGSKAEGEQKVFTSLSLDNPVKTKKVKLEVLTSHWVRIVEFEAVQTKYSNVVQDYAKTQLSQKNGNEVVLKEANLIDKIQLGVTDKDAQYSYEYAGDDGTYKAIAAGDIKSTVKTEDGVFIVLKAAVKAKKVRVTPPANQSISRIELWGLIPEVEED